MPAFAAPCNAFGALHAAGRPGSQGTRAPAARGMMPTASLRPSPVCPVRLQHLLARPPATLQSLLFTQQLGGTAARSAAFLAAGARSAYVRRRRSSSLGASDVLAEQLPAEELSPLQRCLLAHGILDVSYWGQPRFAKYASEEYVCSNVEPKLAALEAHGLQPQHLEPLLLVSKSINTTLLPCTLDTFTTNLEDLVEVMSGYQPERTPRSRNKVDLRGLSTVGQIIARKPDAMLQYLTSSPGSLITVQQWFRDELHVTGTQFETVVWQVPDIINRVMGPHVLEVLDFLDELKGEQGWGRGLLLRCAIVAQANLETVRGNVEVLQGLGLGRQAIVELFTKRPAALAYNFAESVYQQKFAWIREATPWGLSTFLESSDYIAVNLKKMASRLDFIRQRGVAVPDTPWILTRAVVSKFCEFVSQEVGRIVTVAEFEAWVEGEWLPSAQGQRWGKPPRKQRRRKG